MKISSAIISKGSGSLAGMTISRNRGGMYLRQRAVPTNPNTARQVAVRAALGQLSSTWNNVLTPAEREAWNQYGANVPMLDSIGETIHLSGQQHFIRSNVPRLQAGVAIVKPGPVIYNLGDFTAPVVTDIVATTQEIEATVTGTDDWAGEVGSFMLFYQGIPKNPGTSFFKGPFRFIDKLAGAVTPPTVFNNTSLPYVVAADQVDWTRVQVSRVDGRLSQALILGPTSVQ